MNSKPESIRFTNKGIENIIKIGIYTYICKYPVQRCGLPSAHRVGVFKKILFKYHRTLINRHWSVSDLTESYVNGEND